MKCKDLEKSDKRLKNLTMCNNRGDRVWLAGGYGPVNESPNVAVKIFLYIIGTLLVFMSIVLIVQAFGVQVPREVIYGLVVLAIGSGILAGVRRWYG